MMNDVQYRIKEKIEDEIIIPTLADDLARQRERKPKESWADYKLAQRNANKALKARLKYGPDAYVYINKETNEVL